MRGERGLFLMSIVANTYCSGIPLLLLAMGVFLLLGDVQLVVNVARTYDDGVWVWRLYGSLW
jgi:hypothetical protein